MGEACFARVPLGATPREQFHHFWSHATGFALAHPKAMRFLELHHHAPYLDAESRAIQARLLEPAKMALEQAIRANVLKGVRPDLLMAIIWGVLLGVLRSGWEGQLELTADALAQAETCCWEAIRR